MDEFQALKASQDKSNLTLDGMGAARSLNQVFVDGALWAREQMQAELEQARREIERLRPFAHVTDESSAKAKLKVLAQEMEALLLLNETSSLKLAKSHEALRFYAAASNFPLIEIVNCYLKQGSTFDILTDYTAKARAILDGEGT